MIILIHRICMAFSGFGSLRNVEMVISDSAAMLLKTRTQRLVSASLGGKKGSGRGGGGLTIRGFVYCRKFGNIV